MQAGYNGKGHIQITLLRVQLSQKWLIGMRKACSSHRSMANYETKECWHLIFPVTMQGCWCSSLWLACQTRRWTDCRWGGPHSTPSSTPFFCGPAGCCEGVAPAARRTYRTIWLVGCHGGGRWFFGQRIHWSCKETRRFHIKQWQHQGRVSHTMHTSWQTQQWVLRVCSFRIQRPSCLYAIHMYSMSLKQRGHNGLIFILKAHYTNLILYLSFSVYRYWICIRGSMTNIFPGV